MTVFVSASALRALLAAHAAAHRDEPCALLIGRADPRGLRVLEARPAQNVHPTPQDGFLVEPADLVVAGRVARERGLAVVGAWHGHLRGPAWPSYADEEGLRDAAATPDAKESPPYVFLVTGRGAGRAIVLRGFVLHPTGAVVEASVVAARN